MFKILFESQKSLLNIPSCDYSHGSNYSCHLQNSQYEGGENNGGGENDRSNEITAGGEMNGGVENLWDDENDGGGENEGSQINAVGKNHGCNKRMRMM